MCRRRRFLGRLLRHLEWEEESVFVVIIDERATVAAEVQDFRGRRLDFPFGRGNQVDDAGALSDAQLLAFATSANHSGILMVVEGGAAFARLLRGGGTREREAVEPDEGGAADGDPVAVDRVGFNLGAVVGEPHIGTEGAGHQKPLFLFVGRDEGRDSSGRVFRDGVRRVGTDGDEVAQMAAVGIHRDAGEEAREERRQVVDRVDEGDVVGGVGFGEEMITRGSMIVGLRTRFSEGWVWFLSTLLFSALHVPNVIFGLPVWAMPIQVVLTFIMGSGLYAIRRMSGTLILPMILHGLWDSSLFLNVATGGVTSMAQYAVYPLAIACVIAVMRHNRKLP